MTKTMTTKQLKQTYEALFGIQGSRLDRLTIGEMKTAIQSGVANGKAPVRGSAKVRVQVKGYWSDTFKCMVSTPED